MTNKQKQRVIIEDCRAIRQFNEEFNTGASLNMLKALDYFIKDQSLSKENILKVELCRWLNNGCSMFQEDIWDKFKKNATKVAYDIEFDMSVEDTFKESF